MPRRATLGVVATATVCAGACGAVLKPAQPADEPVRLVLTEPWAGGGRLVIVDESGDRRAALLVEPAADAHPAFAPDGRWLVFASSRGRDDGQTSLWVVAAVPEALPVRVTDGAGHDVDPVWSTWRGGSAIVFASDRGGGDLDLYALPIAIDRAGVHVAAPVPLTDGPGDERAPSVAAGRLVFQVIEPDLPRSYIAERAADGSAVALTDGPSDGAPALSPDGRRVAYVTPRVRVTGGRDLDVVVLDADAPSEAAIGLGLDGTDEAAPGWSIDGRWLFATSIAREPDGAPVLSSVVHRDTWERGARVRMLRDHVGAIPRLGAAIAPAILDAAALGRNPDYVPALAAAVAELAEQRAAAERARQQAARRREPL